MDPDTRDRTHAELPTGSNVLAASGYLPILFFLPLLGCKDDRFCRLHGFQSLILFVAFMLSWVVIWVLDIVFGRIMGSIFVIGYFFRALAWLVHHILGAVVSIGYLVLMVTGIVQAAMRNTWHIPVLGVYAERLAGPESQDRS